MRLNLTVSFLWRWLQATIWIAVASLGLGVTFAILPDSYVDENGVFVVIVWLIIVYLVGHYGIWER